MLFVRVCAAIAWCFFSPQIKNARKHRSLRWLNSVLPLSIFIQFFFLPLSYVCLLSSLWSIRFLCIQTSQWFDHMCLHGIPLFLISTRVFLPSFSFNSQYDYRIYKHSHGINRFRMVRVRATDFVWCGVEYLYFALSVCCDCHFLSLVEFENPSATCTQFKNPKRAMCDGTTLHTLWLYDAMLYKHKLLPLDQHLWISFVCLCTWAVCVLYFFPAVLCLISGSGYSNVA